MGIIAWLRRRAQPLIIDIDRQPRHEEIAMVKQFCCMRMANAFEVGEISARVFICPNCDNTSHYYLHSDDPEQDSFMASRKRCPYCIARIIFTYNGIEA